MSVDLTHGWWERLSLTAETVADLRTRAAARNSTSFDIDFANFWARAADPEAYARFSSFSGELVFIHFVCPGTGFSLKVDAGQFTSEGVALQFNVRGCQWKLGWAAE